MGQVGTMARWGLLIAAAAVLTYLSFRGYFSPELLLNFANSFYC
jgi:hypothetical protein